MVNMDVGPAMLFSFETLAVRKRQGAKLEKAIFGSDKGGEDQK